MSRQTITKMADKIAAAYQFASICCCGHSNLVIFIRFLPNFIYSLLPSNPGSSLNMSFVGQTIIKIADKMACAHQFASVRCCGHSNWVIFILISSNFHIWLLLSNPGSSLNMSFVRPMIAKMADKWLPTTSLHSLTPYLSHLLPDCFQISYIDYFYQTLTQVWIWAMSANQNGFQNGPNLWVCTCRHNNLVNYPPISHVSNFILISFIIHWPNFEYGFCLMNDS